MRARSDNLIREFSDSAASSLLLPTALYVTIHRKDAHECLLHLNEEKRPIFYYLILAKIKIK